MPQQQPTHRFVTTVAWPLGLLLFGFGWLIVGVNVGSGWLQAVSVIAILIGVTMPVAQYLVIADRSQRWRRADDDEARMSAEEERLASESGPPTAYLPPSQRPTAAKEREPVR